MANEELDALVDDIPDENQPATDEPAQADATETPAEETPAEEAPAEETQPEPETTPEEDAETESQVAKLFSTPDDGIDHSGKTVPLEKHVALRQRAQTAEAEAAALKAQQAAVNTDALSELNALVDGDDDDAYVDKDALKKVVNKLPDIINAAAQKTVQQTLQQVSAQSTMAKADADEKAFRAKTPDYDAITELVSRRNLLTPQDRVEIFGSPNIAEALYNKAKAAVELEKKALGIAPSAPPKADTNEPEGNQTEIADDEGFQDDNEAFAAFMSGGS